MLDQKLVLFLLYLAYNVFHLTFEFSCNFIKFNYCFLWHQVTWADKYGDDYNLAVIIQLKLNI